MSLNDIVLIVNISLAVFLGVSEYRRRLHQNKESDSNSLNSIANAASTLSESTLKLLEAKDHEIIDLNNVIFEKMQRIKCLEKYIKDNKLILPSCTDKLNENKNSTK